jgi:putative membrane protein insertion efficiency factor
MIGLIRFYQKFISPMSGPKCRFYPSCSEYGLTALRVHGFFRGTALAVWRVLRCNPWSLGGFDPVPDSELAERAVREGWDAVSVSHTVSHTGQTHIHRAAVDSANQAELAAGLI